LWLSGSTTSATISGMISGPIVPLLLLEKVAMFAYKRGMFCESKIVRVCESERENREKRESCNGSSCKSTKVSWELSDPPPCICFVFFL
jgi:hypothetical protein